MVVCRWVDHDHDRVRAPHDAVVAAVVVVPVVAAAVGADRDRRFEAVEAVAAAIGIASHHSVTDAIADAMAGATEVVEAVEAVEAVARSRVVVIRPVLPVRAAIATLTPRWEMGVVPTRERKSQKTRKRQRFVSLRSSAHASLTRLVICH